MLLYPAIDILDGSAVRLFKGDYGQVTEYDSSPSSVAAGFARQGAPMLHVVDLDGARSGVPSNFDAVAEVVRVGGIPVQLGGGLRTKEAIEGAFDTGVERIVLGTAALGDRSLLDGVLQRFGPERVVVSVDYRGGTVATQGWLEVGDVTPESLVQELDQLGVERYLCTKIEVDGTMLGPDMDGLNRIASATSGRVIASGGVGSVADLELLGDRARGNVEGVIVGRALYEGRFTVAEAIGALDGR